MSNYGELEDMLISHLQADDNGRFKYDTNELFQRMDNLEYTSRSLQITSVSDLLQDYKSKYNLTTPQVLYNVAIIGDIMGEKNE